MHALNEHELGKTARISHATTTMFVTLKAGKYNFYCSVPGHEDAGLHGTLIVSSTRRSAQAAESAAGLRPLRGFGASRRGTSPSSAFRSRVGLPQCERIFVRSTMLLPIVAALLGIWGIVALQDRSTDSRRAELQLALLKTDLAALQSAPFQANAQTGGSAVGAARLLRTGESQVNATLVSLRRSNPPAALINLERPLRSNFATLARIYALGILPAGYGREADRLAGLATRQQTTVATLLDSAGQVYDKRATRTDREATAGGVAAILLLLAAFALLYRQNRRMLAASRHEALSDALTGLRNRRALGNDLAIALPRARPERPLLLALFDLDGFKQYNDTFGHPAGDALLVRLAARLGRNLPLDAHAYRMGGDEFCVLTPAEPGQNVALLDRIAELLTEHGETFNVTCSLGGALIPTEANSIEEALRLADRRMYEQKVSSVSAGRQSTDLLLSVLSERSSALQSHVYAVGQLARQVARRLHLPEHEQERIQLAAELHDIGKTAIPDSLLNKPGKLTAEEWRYMRRHTLIGERIILAAPALAHTALLVRSSHERIDGAGYPDGLRGDDTSIGARIIAVCDAYDAMTSSRPYRRALSASEALEELQENAGTQFDPQVVSTFAALALESDTGSPPLAA